MFHFDVRRWRSAAAFVMGAAFLMGGCRPPQDMANPPAFEPYEQTSFFENGSSARPLVEGTVPRNAIIGDEALLTGKENGELATAFPFAVTDQVMARGEERYNIYCSPCHGRTGDGNGMIVMRGYKKPPSYFDPRLMAVRPGHFVDVMTNGFGVMPSYRVQVPPEDRWAIAAYIRALQLSRSATMQDVPADKMTELKSGGAKR